MRRKHNLPPQSEDHEESFSQYTKFLKRSTTAFIGLGLACSILSFIGTYYLFKPDHLNNQSPPSTPSDPTPHVVVDRFDRYPDSQNNSKQDLSTTESPETTITVIEPKHVVSLPSKVRENPTQLFPLLPEYSSLSISVYYPSRPTELKPLYQKKFNQIYTAGFYLSPTGELEKTDEGENTLQMASMTQSDIYISLESKISPEQFYHWISSPDKRNLTINELVKLTRKYNLRGVHINLNQIQLQDQKLFTTFIQELSRDLHDSHKKLSISLHAFINTQNKVENSPAENWHQLGKYADQVIVKPVYIHQKTSYSTNWLDEVIKFTKQQISPTKIHVHIPTNAYINKNDDYWEELSPHEVETLLKTKSDTVRQANGDLISTVQVAGTKKSVIYQDEIGISNKLQTIKANHPDIAGVISEVNDSKNLESIHLIEKELHRSKKAQESYK
ncbi:glycosyl hydrolase family 18 protein [Hazenella coriacea]|uniref:Spore germination protein YaaH n=1 Tax=Hazenella coriacea TaxID=1179467 RepID=A0A4R3KZW4_9BACL|nr:glycosyl hydrolase family 18 protein [Hazenella coriacea]TCS92363.1 spore germination protein YaaH [Hazenella coriacea]